MANRSTSTAVVNNGIWARLRDRERWPRKWWWPHVEPITSTDNLDKHHHETSETIRRAMLTLIAFCFFCAMSLAQPDMMFFGNQTISVPVAQTAVNFAAFMIVAPLTLLGLTIYLHVFLGHARRIAVVPEGDRLPTLFNMERGPGATVAYFVFYWLTPLVLSGFAWKAALHKKLGVWLFVVALITAATLLWVQLRRDLPKGKPLKRALLWIMFAGALFATTDCVVWMFVDREASIVTRNLRDWRSWDLRGALLRDASLRGANLRRARLGRADLRGADLSGANLNEADFDSADLRGALLLRADLRNANFEDTQLECTFVAEANFAGAVFKNTDLTYTIGVSPALVDEGHRTGLPELPMKRTDVRASCREYERVMLKVDERIEAFERLAREQDGGNAPTSP